MWQKEVIELAFYAGGMGAAFAFALHWLMQDGHPLFAFEQYVQKHFIARPKLSRLGHARYYFGMWLVGCAVCQSFWFGLVFCLIFTSVPIGAALFAGLFAMVLTYKIY